MWRTVLLLCWLNAGCVAPAPTSDASCGATDLTLFLGQGTGRRESFTRLDEGAEVVLTPGSQGAQHIWVDLRAAGSTAPTATVRLRASLADSGRLIAEQSGRATLALDPGGGVAFAIPLVLGNGVYCLALGKPLTLEARLQDADGRCGSTQRSVLLRGWDPRAPEVQRRIRQQCCDLRLRRCFPDGGVAEARDVPLG